MKQDVYRWNPWTIAVEPDPLMGTSSMEPAPEDLVLRIPSGRHNPCVISGSLKIADLLAQKVDASARIDSAAHI